MSYPNGTTLSKNKLSPAEIVSCVTIENNLAHLCVREFSVITRRYAS